MEEAWMRDRALLRDLLEQTPQASPQELARATGRSVSWLKKWRQRLTQGDPHDPHLVCARSRAHHAPYFRWDDRVMQRIVAMRLSPPENADRGCLARGPCSTTCLVTRSCRKRRSLCLTPAAPSGRSCTRRAACSLVPKSRPTPTSFESRWKRSRWMQKDVGSVSPEQSPQGKRQHVIEVCNFLDAGTSIALLAQAREDFHEQTAMEAVITFLRQYGCPRQMTFDRDPRWVGSVSGRDFPSPLRRLLLCLGITPHVCPPHRPDRNAYVERYHRTSGQECLQIHRPSTLQEVTRP
jgi:transposase InsO family protein